MREPVRSFLAFPAWVRRAPLVLTALLALVPSGVQAQQKEAAGLFVSVAPPINGELINRIERTIHSDHDRWQRLPVEQRKPYKIVFDFNPDGMPNNASDIEACIKLARVIRELENQRSIKTTAFVHGKITNDAENNRIVQGRVEGHTVLPVLACSEVILSQDAQVGPILRRGQPKLLEHEKVAYATLVAPKFKNHVARLLQQEGFFYDQKAAQDAGLAEKISRETREDVAAELGLPRSSLREVPYLAKTVAWQIKLTGEVNSALKEKLERRIREAINGGVNLLVLELKCSGGDPAVAANIANYLLTLNDKHSDVPVVTIAWFTEEARNTSLIIGLGCDHMAMAPNARLGDFGQLIKGKSPSDIDALVASLTELARKQYYPPSLIRAFVDPRVGNLFYCVGKRGASEWKIMTGTEYDAAREKQPNYWDATPIKLEADGLLSLNEADARKYGLTFARVENIKGLYNLYGVQPSQVRMAGPDWLDDLADFLKSPWTQFFLVMIGITCLILELKMPGASIPGIIAAVCFILFFWSHLNSQVTWLALLLFLLGLVLLGLEIFVLPGFGVCGITGLVLTLGSLSLVAYGHWPTTSKEWASYGRGGLVPIFFSLVGAVACAFLLAKYLHHIPFINRLILKPRMESQEPEEHATSQAQQQLVGLLGAIGVAATPLRPAGKVQFGDQFVDVVAEGGSGYVEPGTRVQVIEIEGIRVVVKPV